MIKQVWEDIRGKKTYTVCVATAIYGVAGIYLGLLSPQEAVQMLLAAAGLASVRHAL